MKRLIVLIILITSFFTISSQTIIIKGEQHIVANKEHPELTCTPVKITTTMKIEKAQGKCNGFWIQKGSVTTNKFTNLEDAKGTILKPGIYYVYPYLKEGEKKANVKVTIVSQNRS